MNEQITAAASTRPNQDKTELRHVLDTLRGVLDASESDTARIAAAKLLLERLDPESKEDKEAKLREDDERQAALDEARCLLGEIAAAQLIGAQQPAALD